MRGNIAGSTICFLAFLSVIRTQNVVNPPDLLKDALPEGAFGQPNIRRSGEPSDDDAEAEAINNPDQQYKLDDERSGFSEAHAQAHAEASSGGRNEYLMYNPYNTGSLYPSPPQGTGSSSASAQAQAVSEGGGLSGQGLNPYSPGSLYPSSYGSGSNSALAQAIAEASSGGGGLRGPYSPGSLYPSSPSSSGSSSAFAQALAEAGGQGGQRLKPGSNSYLPGSSSNAGSSSAQAQAEAISGGGLNGLGLNPGLNGYDLGSSSASAQALADASNGGSPYGQGVNPGIISYSPESLYPSSLYNSGSSSATAQALADASNGGNPSGQGVNPGINPISSESLYPGSPYNSGSSSASGQALTDASNAGSPYVQGVNPGINPYSPESLYPGPLYNSGSSSASAQALADVSNGGSPRGQETNPGLNPYLPESTKILPAFPSGSSSAQAQAEAINGGENFQYLPDLSSGTGSSPVQNLADAPNGDSNVNQGFNLYSTLAPSFPDNLGAGSNKYPEANVPALSGGQAQAYAQAIARAANTGNLNHRPIPQNEYILPYNVPGVEKVIICKRADELHYIWTNEDCFVCACVGHHGSTVMRPVCASCSGCLNPNPVTPPSPPLPPSPPPQPHRPTSRPSTPAPPPSSTTLPPPPPPPPQVTCSPLPSGVPFQNPLHPCQICICTESVTVFGEPDVQIECQENQQCVVPPDGTTLPPVPDERPRPLPQCKNFPQNVYFPYPADPCKLCKCSVSVSEYGIPEEQISCYPNPACEPQPFTKPASASTTNAVTESYITVTTPRPVTTPAPPAPGPLPGPSPHESCRPYQPNQPFQHPWDECQLCICTESYTVGLITIEVNCFNKKSCCVDLDPVTQSPVPNGGVIGNAGSHASAIAQANSILLPYGNQPSNILPGRVPQNHISGQSNQPEYALAPQGNQIIQEGLVPETVMVPLGHQHRPGENHLDDILGLQGHRPKVGQSVAEATALAQSQVNQPSIDEGQRGYILGQQGYLNRPGDNYPGYNLVQQGNQPRPGAGQYLADGLVSPQSQINQGLGNSQPSQIIGQYGIEVPQIIPGGVQSAQYQVPGMSPTDPDSLSTSLSGYNMHQPRYYQGYNLLGYDSPGYYNYPAYYTGYTGNRGLGYKSDISSADAVANANGGSSANAEASASSQGLGQTDASGNAQSGILGGTYDYRTQDYTGYSAGIPASLIYSNLYSRPSYEITPLYQPGRVVGGNSNAQAQAQAQSQSLGGSAQAQASAVSGVRNKSGKPEDEEEDEQDKRRK